VERWRNHCGDTADGKPDWTQAWRRPLFDALHVLDDELARVFEESKLFKDPWAAREAYINVLLDSGLKVQFLQDHTIESADPARVWSLLEMQRFAMLMFASCGWFFDDPARLETRQVLRYAGRALELCPPDKAVRARALFLEHLRPLRSNKHPELDGAMLFEDVVSSSRSGQPAKILYEDLTDKETSSL